MSIQQMEHTTFYDVECDDCGDAETFDASDWSDLMDQMRSDGWTKTKAGDIWEHYCPVCSGNVEDYEEEDEDGEDDDEEDD